MEGSQLTGRMLFGKIIKIDLNMIEEVSDRKSRWLNDEFSISVSCGAHGRKIRLNRDLIGFSVLIQQILQVNPNCKVDSHLQASTFVD